LLASGAEREVASFTDSRVKLIAAAGALSLLGALALIITSGLARNPGVFFGAGSLLLISGIAFSHTLLAATARDCIATTHASACVALRGSLAAASRR
jgi:hypothetical protein